ncbi:sulfur carrier protein ThiS [Gordonia sp. PP30]|uniref:sulfur carrier protein ThiS n=1 Tax=unclassified Gordonia (in: high G+C Gram-positive bacteria) TaxID=2657482 RepID=UPI0020000414|nr:MULTISPECIES: sulfur carrier protein ThiS [unclassified Gordonia (in: high G+C Gram-positive bacteria)]UQE75407.1 sulfur carrier protein ThiS [Gordonia sp. PP30]
MGADGIVELTVNGEAVTFDREPDVAGLLARLDLPERGVAVAIDGVVRPRSRWDEPIGRYAVVDVLTAVQGG